MRRAGILAAVVDGIPSATNSSHQAALAVHTRSSTPAAVVATPWARAAAAETEGFAVLAAAAVAASSSARPSTPSASDSPHSTFVPALVAQVSPRPCPFPA